MDAYCLIGAGPVGLAVANALRHAGIPYEQVESDDDVGGNWRHGVYRSAHIISSRKTTEFSDYPMPDSYPDFPSADQMLAYLRDYAQHFELYPQIRFGRTVTAAVPLEDDRWSVTFGDGEQRVYRGVIVCNGHHWSPRWPSYPGTFAGEFIHSKQYHDLAQLAGKRVLTIGAGNSACDVASAAATVGACSHLSVRRGSWFLPKTAFGIPLVELMQPWLPVFAQRLMLRAILAVVFGDYARYGLPKPQGRIFDMHPTLNSDLLHHLKHGRIIAKPGIARFDGSRVCFTDGTSETYDLIVAATGYDVNFPFLPEGLVGIKNGNNAQVLFGFVPPKARNLYIAGAAQPRYGFGPLVTPASELLAKVIRLQERLDVPLGYVLEQMGMRPPSTHLVDPHAARRMLKFAHLAFPAIERKARKLQGKPPAPPRLSGSHAGSAST